MNAKKRWVLAGMLAALLLSGCGQAQDEVAGGEQGVVSGKVYVVGSDATYAPFEYQNERKEVVGFDIDVLQAVAKKGGFQVRVVNTPWEGVFASLNQGDRDVVASAVTITTERKQTMDFSEPYFEAHQLIAIGKGVADIKDFQGLKDKKVAVQAGTTGDELVQRLLGKGSANIKRFETMPLALQELQNGGVEAVVGDNGVVVNYAKNNPQHGIATIADPKSFESEFYGFAVKKGNKALLDKINAGIKAIKADGTYDQIYKKYFVSS